MTDQEIHTIANDHFTGGNNLTAGQCLRFARAIEAAATKPLLERIAQKQARIDQLIQEVAAGATVEAAQRERIAALEAKLAQRVPDTDCPRCKGSEVRGFKRGVKCSACDGTGNAPEAAPAAPEQQEPKKEISNVELDRDSNTTGNRQQRNMVRALEVGQLVAKSRKQGGGDPAAEKELKLIVKGFAEPIAQATAENCRSVPQLTFPHIYLGLTDLILEFAQAPNAQQAEAQEPVEYQFQDRNGTWCWFMNERHRLNTIADGTWPIRPLFTRSQPAQLQALSEEETVTAWRGVKDVGDDKYNAILLSEAIQSALAAKNWAVLE